MLMMTAYLKILKLAPEYTPSAYKHVMVFVCISIDID